jgi:hypothetical protein
MLEKYGELDRALEYAELGSVIDAAAVDVETNIHCNMVKGRILARRKQPDEAKTCLETAASIAGRVGMLYVVFRVSPVLPTMQGPAFAASGSHGAAVLLWAACTSFLRYET